MMALNPVVEALAFYRQALQVDITGRALQHAGLAARHPPRDDLDGDDDALLNVPLGQRAPQHHPRWHQQQRATTKPAASTAQPASSDLQPPRRDQQQPPPPPPQQQEPPQQERAVAPHRRAAALASHHVAAAHRAQPDPATPGASAPQLAPSPAAVGALGLQPTTVPPPRVPWQTWQQQQQHQQHQQQQQHHHHHQQHHHQQQQGELWTQPRALQHAWPPQGGVDTEPQQPSPPQAALERPQVPQGGWGAGGAHHPGGHGSCAAATAVTVQQHGAAAAARVLCGSGSAGVGASGAEQRPWPGEQGSSCPQQQRPQASSGRRPAMTSSKPLLDKLLAAQEDGEGASGSGSSSSSRWAWLGSGRKDAQGRSPGTPGYDPSTLQLPPPATFSQLSHFAQQFWTLKSRAMDVVLFVKHGSFYNLFDVDADVGLRVGLNISGPRTPNMWKVGCCVDVFPLWAAKVLALGYSVGRVEEMPADSQAPCGAGRKASRLLVRRLVKIYTPGMSVEGVGPEAPTSRGGTVLFVAEQQPAIGASAAARSAAAGRGAPLGCCLLDLAAGQCLVGAVADPTGHGGLAALLLRHAPCEVVAARGGLSRATLRLLQLHCREEAQGDVEGADGCRGLAADAGARAPTLLQLPASLLDHQPAARRLLRDQLSAGAFEALQQCLRLQESSSSVGGAAEASVLLAALQLLRCGVATEVLATLQVAALDPHHSAPGGEPAAHMQLDERALCVLDVLGNSLGASGGGGSLLALLDRTATGPGRRRLRQWLSRPLTQVSSIEERLAVLDLFKAHPDLAEQLQAQLRPLPDPEHLLPRAAAALRQLLPALQGSLAEQHRRLQQQAQLACRSSPAAEQQAAAALATAGCAVADGSTDPADCSWSSIARASVRKALQQLPECLSCYVDAVALLQHSVQQRLHADTSSLPLLHGAVLAAAAVAPALADAAPVLSGLRWDPPASTTSRAAAADGQFQPPAAHQQGKRRRAAPQQQPEGRQQGWREACAASAAGLLSPPGGEERFGLHPGVCPDYDAACHEAEAAVAAFEAALQEECAWYEAGGPGLHQLPTSSSSGGGSRQPQQRLGAGPVVVAVEAALQGVLQVPVAALAAAGRLPLGHQLLSPGPGGGCAAAEPPPAACRVLVRRLQLLGAGATAARRAVGTALAAAVADAAGLILHHYGQLQQLIWAVAAVDVVAGFAAATAPGAAPPGCGFCRPVFAAASAAAVAAAALQQGGGGAAAEFSARGLWHPLLARGAAGSGSSSSSRSNAADVGVQSQHRQASGVVPNDVCLGGAPGRPTALLLTGANTCGKSTLLRATGLAALMAGVGCYVPATSLRLTPFDAIFTRVGAQDSIMARRSTFMVEMSETSRCLGAATAASLVILDELGRGTSAHDGYAIAYAVLRHLVSPPPPPPGPGAAAAARCGGVRPLLLFATHYHQLAQEASLGGHLLAGHMAASLAAGHDQLRPLYQLRPGAAPRGSCGVQAAAAAGLPAAVVERAAAVVQALVGRRP